MCGILAVIQPERGPLHTTPERIDSLSGTQRHRGPDGRGMATGDSFIIAHERLAIIDPQGGAQPFQSSCGRFVWAANAEIYNHTSLRIRERLGAAAASDCAVIGPLFEQFGESFVSMLDGMFALIVVDRATGRFVAARDHMGICPLYVGRSRADGAWWFASEMKCLIDDCEEIDIVEPGTMFVGDGRQVRHVRWDAPEWREDGAQPDEAFDPQMLREALVDAVRKRLMSDVPFGVLLSGGLDSSLIASIASREAARMGTGPIHSFSIGLPGSPDLFAAREAAKSLDTVHHEFHFSIEEALDAVEPTIRHLESFEQIRAGVPLYLLAKHIRAAGFRMVLSGEGADEIFGGYLFFHHAPGADAMHAESLRLVRRLHQWDVMRANKAAMAHGVEVRVPFLDRAFLEVAMSIDPREKMIDACDLPDGRHPRIEKYILRKAFDEPRSPWLPPSILWRQKEQFSDGVGYAWVDALRARAEEDVTDEMWLRRTSRFDSRAPHTREGYLLREAFERVFVTGRRGGAAALRTVPMTRSIACSTEEALAWRPDWREAAGDISGRAVGVHAAARVS